MTSAGRSGTNTDPERERRGGHKTRKRHWTVAQSWTSDPNKAFKSLAPIYEPLWHSAGSVMGQISAEAAPGHNTYSSI